MTILEDTVRLMAEYPRNPKPEISKFRILGILDLTNHEVYICRLLAALLEPNGKHGLGILPLKSFFQQFLEIPVRDEELENISVITEYSIDSENCENPRRIDIVIRNNIFFIPIEVKIWAEDQAQQVQDYLSFVRQWVPASKLYYLTPDEHMPSKKSMGYLTDHDIHARSFARHILPWLKSLPSSPEEGVNVLVKELCQFFANYVQQDFQGREKLKENIKNNEEYLKAALEIEKTLVMVKAELMLKTFASLKNGIAQVADEFGLILVDGITPELIKKCHEYYDKGKLNYPSITYYFKNPIWLDKENQIQLALQIEIYYNIYYVYKAKNIHNEDVPITEALINEANKYIPTDKASSRSLTFRYLLDGDTNEKTTDTINFRRLNERFCSLPNNIELNEIVTKAIVCLENRVLTKKIKEHQKLNNK